MPENTNQTTRQNKTKKPKNKKTKTGENFGMTACSLIEKY